MNTSNPNQPKITTIYVTSTSLQEMTNLAQKHGYFQKRGVGAKKIGSISQLIEAIAQGELILQNPEQHS